MSTTPAALLEAEHHLELSFRAEPLLRGHEQGRWYCRLAEKSADIEMTLAVLEGEGRYDDYLDLCWNLFTYWRGDAGHQRGVALMERVLDRIGIDGVPVEHIDGARVARAHYACAHLGLDISLSSAAGHAARGLAVAEVLGDSGLIGRLTADAGCDAGGSR